MNYNFSNTIINSLTLFSNNLENKLEIKENNKLINRYVLKDKKINGYSLFLKNYCTNKKDVNNYKIMNVWNNLSGDEKSKYTKKEVKHTCQVNTNSEFCNKSIFQDNLCKSHYKKIFIEKYNEKCLQINNFYESRKSNMTLNKYNYENNEYFKDVFDNIYKIENTELIMIGYLIENEIIYL